MNYKKLAITLILSSFFAVSFCQGQNIQYRSKIRPNVKAKLDSLYPHARGILLDQSRVYDTIQIIRLGCNCEETKGMIILTFDTNANLLNKEVHYNFIKDLPDTVVSYMKKNTSPTVKFLNNFMSKSINNKGEISYGIYMTEIGATGYNSYDEYILKFKPTGELISKEKQELEAR